MRSRMATLDLRRKAVIMMRDGMRLLVDGSYKRVVMSNEAAMRRLYTRGNNEVLLRHFFSVSALIVLTDTCG
jgi:hypothetical protein